MLPNQMMMVILTSLYYITTEQAFPLCNHGFPVAVYTLVDQFPAFYLFAWLSGL